MELNRNEKGEVTVENINFCVPETISAISVVGDNLIENGDSFCLDGYIYNGDKKRKWYISCHRFGFKSLWVAKQENLKYLHNLLLKLNNKIDAIYNQKHEITKPFKSKDNFKLYAKPTHKFSLNDGDNKIYWVYNFRKEDNNQFSYGFEWITKPKHKLNGQKFYELEQRASYFGKYRFGVENFFIDCVKNLLDKPKKIQYIEVNVGQFTLIFKSATRDYNNFWWEFENFGKIEQKTLTF